MKTDVVEILDRALKKPCNCGIRNYEATRQFHCFKCMERLVTNAMADARAAGRSDGLEAALKAVDAIRPKIHEMMTVGDSFKLTSCIDVADAIRALVDAGGK